MAKRRAEPAVGGTSCGIGHLHHMRAVRLDQRIAHATSRRQKQRPPAHTHGKGKRKPRPRTLQRPVHEKREPIQRVRIEKCRGFAENRVRSARGEHERLPSSTERRAHRPQFRGRPPRQRLSTHTHRATDRSTTKRREKLRRPRSAHDLDRLKTPSQRDASARTNSA